MWNNLFKYIHYSIALFTFISLDCCHSATQFPKTCPKLSDDTEVSINSGIPRAMLDFYFITDTGETDGVKMMRKFTYNQCELIKSLTENENNWISHWTVIEGVKRGLDHVCEEYESVYNELFPYRCYAEAKWCLMGELFDKLLYQMGTIWKPSGVTLQLTQPWLNFFSPPDYGWRKSYLNEMKMACETLFHHPLLGPMTKKIRQNSEDLKNKIVSRVYFFVEQNQHENLKIFFKRFEWIKQPFEGIADNKVDAFTHDMKRLFRVENGMISDSDDFNWNYRSPPPRKREIFSMLWLTIPKIVRDLFPSQTSNPAVLDRLQRFLQTAFDNVLEENTEALEELKSHTMNLINQLKEDCNEESDIELHGLECEVLIILTNIKKLLDLVKTSGWENKMSLDVKSATLISFLATKSKQFFEVTTPKLRDIVSDTFERFYVYSKQTDVTGLERYIKFMPSLKLINIGRERGCSEYFHDLKTKIRCIIQNTLRETLLYIKTLRRAPLNTKIISTTYNIRDQLRGAQLSAISAQIDQQAIENKANLDEFTNEIKTFISQETGQRFAALEGYFKGIADFDERKAKADIGYITGRLKTFDDAVKKVQAVVEKKLTAVIIGSVASSVAEVAQKGAALVVKSIFACNPFDPDPGAVIDAADEFAKTFVTLTRSSKLVFTFKTAFDETSKVSKNLSENNEFIKKVQDIVYTLPNKLTDNVEFLNKTTEFLEEYLNYDPKVQRQEIAKIGTDWEAYLQEACDTLFEGGSSSSAIVQRVFAGLGQCLTTQGDISKMLEIYSEIYDYQFELMETLASAVRAYQSQFFANRLDTRLRVASEQDVFSEEDNTAISLYHAMLSFHLIHRIHTLQLVLQHCNYLQFKNAGEMPSVCQSALETLEYREINNLIAFQPQTCTPESFKFVNIPTTRSNADVSISWINMTRLYQGEEVAFQVPSFKWLVDNNWITAADSVDTAIYLTAFELFLPSAPNAQSRHFSRRQHQNRGNIIASDHAVSVGELGYDNNISTSNIFRRTSRNQRDIQFRITAKNPSPLFPANKATKFSLQPYRIYSFEYQENAESCRQKAIKNPYSPRLPKICPLSSPPRKNKVDPSIFSLWKVKLEAPVFSSVPQEAKSNVIKAAVRMCKVKRPSSLSKRNMKKN